MLNCADYFRALQQLDFTYFCGVPDSLLKDLCAYIAEHCRPENHVIPANEGAAVALAAGYHVATGRTGVVYMQNSGLGNAVNPLTSLVDPEVYSIPVLLLIGWRGEPGRKDEPQHKKQGRVSLELLRALEIPCAVHPKTMPEAERSLREAKRVLEERRGPFAFLIQSETFERHVAKPPESAPGGLKREEAIIAVLEEIGEDAVVVTTTGMASREVFEYRARAGQGHHRDFLTVGSMGHASQIALAIALAQPKRAVYCLDGDGAVLMHMGALALIGSQKPQNLRHIVLNNGAHDSVGGQPTVAFQVDLTAVAKACGYRLALRATSSSELASALTEVKRTPGPVLLETRVTRGARPDLGRPTQSPVENKALLMKSLSRA